MEIARRAKQRHVFFGTLTRPKEAIRAEVRELPWGQGKDAWATVERAVAVTSSRGAALPCVMGEDESLVGGARAFLAELAEKVQDVANRVQRLAELAD